MTGDKEAQQADAERAAVDAMYRRFDQGLAEARDAYGRAIAATIENPADLHARDVEVSRLTRVMGELRAAERALCFGRIDAANGDSLHIGRIGLRDEAGELLVVDWRADAARPFYAATAMSPLGLRRRRHLRMEGRTVVGVSDELLDGSAPTSEDVIGDGPLVEALGRARTGRMREAVSTLQAEQDAIVRSSHRGVTVVQGGPGTGKTIVALHRAAYVLYAFPRIAERGVLVYGPNRRFLDYIGDVLPSLGENDVQLATAADLVGAMPNAADDAAVTELKGRAELAAALADRVRDRRPHGTSLTVSVGHETLTLAPSAIDRARRDALRDAHAHNPARERFREHVIDDLVDLMEQRAAETLDAIDAEVASVLGMDLDQAAAADLRRLGFDDAVTVDGQPEFDRERVRSSLVDDPAIEAAIERIWPRLRATTVLRRFLADRAALPPRLTPGEVAPPIRRSTADLTPADLALLDEVRNLVDGPPEQVFGHIVVDEAQELTEMEWRMLMRRCPSRSMTIVGDFAQAGSATTIRTWETALSPFVADRVEQHTLTVNYRTTTEILQESIPLLARIAPDQQPSRSIRHGDPPRTITTTPADLLGAIDELVRQDRDAHPDELVGVICPPARVDALTSALHGTGTTIVAAADARGLEFDAVVLVDPAAIEAGRAAGARDLYVAMTRATKRLVVVDPEPDRAFG